MLVTIEARGERVEEAASEQFLAMLCADEELLNAEFDAIIAAEWPTPPMRTTGRGADQQRPAAPAGVPLRRGSLPGRSARPGVDGWARQRSPPRAQ